MHCLQPLLGPGSPLEQLENGDSFYSNPGVQNLFLVSLTQPGGRHDKAGTNGKPGVLVSTPEFSLSWY